MLLSTPGRHRVHRVQTSGMFIGTSRILVSLELFQDEMILFVTVKVSLRRK